MSKELEGDAWQLLEVRMTTPCVYTIFVGNAAVTQRADLWQMEPQHFGNLMRIERNTKKCAIACKVDGVVRPANKK